jgi:hypothetical protein
MEAGATRQRAQQVTRESIGTLHVEIKWIPVMSRLSRDTLSLRNKSRENPLSITTNLLSSLRGLPPAAPAFSFLPPSYLVAIRFIEKPQIINRNKYIIWSNRNIS